MWNKTRKSFITIKHVLDILIKLLQLGFEDRMATNHTLHTLMASGFQCCMDIHLNDLPPRYLMQ